MVYYAEVNCENEKCKNKAYVESEKKYYCKVHCKNGTALPKRPKTEVVALNIKREEDRRLCEDKAQIKNVEKGRKGKVKMTRLTMVKGWDYKEGYFPIFPNYRQARTDGLSMQSLSPFKLGPVIINDELRCETLEIYWQYSKVYESEISARDEVLDIFFEKRKKFFKYRIANAVEWKKMKTLKKGPEPEIPIFALHELNGKEKRYDYVSSRYFYCTYYAALAEKENDLAKLRTMMDEGLNIQLVGYDSFDLDKNDSEEIALYKAFKNSSFHFGHEAVLYCLLTLNPKNYPWVVYKRKHESIFA